MGMALGMGGAILSAQKEMPTQEDQIKMRDIVYKYIPDIREKDFQLTEFTSKEIKFLESMEEARIIYITR